MRSLRPLAPGSRAGKGRRLAGKEQDWDHPHQFRTEPLSWPGLARPCSPPRERSPALVARPEPERRLRSCRPLDPRDKPYAVYWSIYTDHRGRQHFRQLYWDRLKDLIGRPAKLVGIEREEHWPSKRPVRELRCHVWRHFRARSDAEAIVETLRAASRVAPVWRVMIAPRPERSDDPLHQPLSIIWDRHPDRADLEQLPLPLLSSILVQIHRDTGFRIRPGIQVLGGGEKERPTGIPLLDEPQDRRFYAVTWRMQVQTSTKRSLMETHWPRLQNRFGTHAEMVDLERRSGETGPYKFSIRQDLRDVTESEAVARILAQASGLRISLTMADDGSIACLRGIHDRAPVGTYSVMGFEAMRLPS